MTTRPCPVNCDHGHFKVECPPSKPGTYSVVATVGAGEKVRWWRVLACDTCDGRGMVPEYSVSWLAFKAFIK